MDRSAYGRPAGTSPRREAFAPQTRRCDCGREATHRIAQQVPSNVGLATRYEVGCTRCLERVAKSMLAAGESTVEVERIGE